MTDTAALFAPLLVKQVTLRNRIVMSPMTRRFSPGGVPTEEVANYYLRRVHGGVGLIITEGVGIDHPGPAGDNVVWNLDPEQVRKEGEPTLPMSHREIDEVIEGYVRSAASAKQVGFDGIAIHGAHGYMPDAFLWSGTNRRSDRYGGDVAQRTVFVQEMIRAIRGAVGAAMPITLRFSQWKQQDYAARLAHTPQELGQLLLPISEAGVDIFDASTRWFWKPEFPGSDLNLAGWAQKLTGKRR
jgi:2,4-dienoyl-CoA reductase-like NADH-dependent reductase (Old Yellow Enzyme family)